MRAAPPPQMSRPAPPPQISRPAMPAPQMQRPQPTPRFAAPPRPAAPRIAAPPPRSAPAVQRTAPPPRAASRPDIERRAQPNVQQRIDRAQEQTRSRLTGSDQRELRRLERSAQPGVQQRIDRAQEQTRSRLTGSDQRELRRLERSAQQQQAAGQRLQRLQARSESGRLSRIEQRDLRRLQLSEQRQKSTAQRLQQLQTRSESGRLSRVEQRELGQLQRRDQLQRTAAQRLEQLQTQSKNGRLDRAEQRELRQLERQQRALGFEQRQSTREQAGVQGGRTARVTPQQAAEGRFAASFAAARNERRDDWRLRHQPPRAVWRHGLRASYVPWLSAVYWPYAYSDVFYYSFWPDAYEESYWAYVYDDFFDGIYFPYGAPHVDYAYAGPYGTIDEEGVTTGSAPPQRQRTASAPGRVSQAVRVMCTQPDEGVTAWPIKDIEEAVQPSSEQKRLLVDLKKAAEAAATEFRQACPESLPMTPPSRLQAMTMRLEATLDAVKTVRPALEAFYGSLSDDQKASFNEIRPKLKEDRAATAQTADRSGACSGQKAGLSALPIDEIDRVVRPTDAQVKALERLDERTRQAVEILNKVCPTSTPGTPVGRLEMMQERLEAMIEAANSVRPALQDFYAALNDEQKAKFNRLGRDSARGG
jgi:hypothetical protein